MTHPVEGRYIDWPLRAALADIDERLRKIEAAHVAAAYPPVHKCREVSDTTDEHGTRVTMYAYP